MPSFKYKALDATGQKVIGIEEALSMDALAQALRKKSVYLLRADVQKPQGARRFSGRISASELVHFTDQLVIVIGSGIPILVGLREISEDLSDLRFQAVLNDVAEQIEQGASLSEALSAYPKIFDASYISVAAAGEEMGGLDTVLSKLARQMEWAQETKRQVRSAMIQPAFLGMAVLGLTIMVVTTLVPQIVSIFERSGVELPAMTQMLVEVSRFIRGYWMLLVGLVVVGVASWRLAKYDGRTRLLKDAFIQRIPIVGPVVKLFATARFVNLFGVLHDAGVVVDRNLEIISGATGSAVTDAGVVAMRRAIMDGKTIAEGARSCEAFPALVVRMLAIGEQAGHLPEALARAGEYYDKEIKRGLKRIITVLQPTLLILSACVVAFVVFAAFLPIIKLVSGGHG